MKTVIICLISLLFVGCASVSDYNQGCRDGVRVFLTQNLKAGYEDGWINKGCDALELKRKEQKESREGKRS